MILSYTDKLWSLDLLYVNMQLVYKGKVFVSRGRISTEYQYLSNNIAKVTLLIEKYDLWHKAFLFFNKINLTIFTIPI
jgi:hypothetical protein